MLENQSVTQIDETVLDLRKQDYVANVQLIRVESGAEDTGSLAEIWVTLDEATLRGEAAQ